MRIFLKNTAAGACKTPAEQPGCDGESHNKAHPGTGGPQCRHKVICPDKDTSQGKTNYPVREHIRPGYRLSIVASAQQPAHECLHSIGKLIDGTKEEQPCSQLNYSRIICIETNNLAAE